MKPLSKKEWIGVAAAIVFISYTMFGQTITDTFFVNSNNEIESNDNLAAVNSSENSMSNVTTSDVVVGSGDLVGQGMAVSVHYILKLSDGTVIQDSKQVNAGEPFSFIFGQSELIPGWELGMAGMRVGGKRVITIPPELGYGSQPVGPIPGNSTLIFEIEVVSAKLPAQ